MLRTLCGCELRSGTWIKAKCDCGREWVQADGGELVEVTFQLVEKLFDEVTKDWTAADWEQTSANELHYHIAEWLDAGGDVTDLFMAKFEFEQYMGW